MYANVCPASFAMIIWANISFALFMQQFSVAGLVIPYRPSGTQYGVCRHISLVNEYVKIGTNIHACSCWQLQWPWKS